MSRGYRVRFPTPVSVVRTDTARAKDLLRMDIDLLPILDAAEMHALLSEVLKADGWQAVDGHVEVQIGDAVARLQDDHIEIELEGKRVIRTRGANANQVDARLATLRSAAEEALTTDLRRRMAKIEAALCEQLEPAVQRVYVEALKRKAAALGEVQSIDERRDGTEVELTIKVKV